MYRYVFKRFKDTIEFGFNVRKNFACTQTLNKTYKNNDQNNDIQKNRQQNNNSILRYQEVNFLASSTQRVNYDDFKRKYNCKHPNSCNPFLQAITWVSKVHNMPMALIIFSNIFLRSSIFYYFTFLLILTFF